MHRSRFLLAAIVVIWAACDARHTSKFEKKARCAALGRSFIGDLEKQTAGVPPIINVTFA
jgi:hypothetical protein